MSNKKNHNKSSLDSSSRKEWQQKVDAFFESHGYIDWNEIGATPYVRYYHDLSEYASQYQDSSLEEDEEYEPNPSSPMVKKNTYVVTCAVKGWGIDTNFIKSLISYCEKNDAQILLAPRAPMIGEMEQKNIKFQDEHGEILDQDNVNYVDYFQEIASLSDRISVIESDIALNNQITFLDAFLNLKTANPIASLKSIGSKVGSVILAATKQIMEAVPSSKNELPYIVMTTGCINTPQYTSRMYQTPQEVVAELDHHVGAVIVEIEDDNYFHFRHVRANSDGSFTDYGTLYSDDSSEDNQTDSMVLGDWHSGYTDVIAASAVQMMAEELKPSSVVLHDLIDGHSINHHEKDNMTARMYKYYSGKLDVMSEMLGVAQDLAWFNSLGMKPIIVKSNHDDFIERYLNSQAWTSEPSTYLLFSQLAAKQSKAAFLQQHIDLAHEAVSTACELKSIKMPEAEWLRRDIKYTIRGVDISHHGDKIANGRPSSIASISKHLGKCITGHNHSPAMFRDAYRVGTTSKLDLNYNVGPSSWLHTLCLIHKDGSMQLINIIEGRFKAGKRASKPANIASNR